MHKTAGRPLQALSRSELFSSVNTSIYIVPPHAVLNFKRLVAAFQRTGPESTPVQRMSYLVYTSEFEHISLQALPFPMVAPFSFNPDSENRHRAVTAAEPPTHRHRAVSVAKPPTRRHRAVTAAELRTLCHRAVTAAELPTLCHRAVTAAELPTLCHCAVTAAELPSHRHRAITAAETPTHRHRAVTKCHRHTHTDLTRTQYKAPRGIQQWLYQAVLYYQNITWFHSREAKCRSMYNY